MNTNYGHLDPSTNRLVYAADTATVGGVRYANPSAAMYLRCNPPEKRIYTDAPSESAPEGKHYEPDGWDESATEIRRKWKLVDNPPALPRVFVTADLVEVLMEEGIWGQVRAWIVEQGMLDLVLCTPEFPEDNANFAAGRAALQTALGWTDEEVEELLAKCVKEGV